MIQGKGIEGLLRLRRSLRTFSLRVLPLAALAVAGCGTDSTPSGAADSATVSGSPASASAQVRSAAALGAPQALPVPAAPGSGQPHLAVTPAGEAVLSWQQAEGEGHALHYSRLVGGEWSAAQAVAAGSDFFVNWADIPSVVPITEDVWIAHWLKMAEGSFASYDIAISVSQDGGRSWSAGTLLNDDGVLTEHGFVTLYAWGGDIGAIWLDGRRLAEQFELGIIDENAPPIGMSLRYARIGLDGHVRERGEIDELACDCCRTDAAGSASGPVIVYRDRTPEEIRDISVRRHDGSAWSPAVTLGPDGWHIEGCPVNGPAVAARGEEVVAAWFTAPGNEPKVELARSSDGGQSFGTPVVVDAAGSFGHVDVVLLEDGDAVVGWWRRGANGDIELAARRAAADGTLGDVRAVAVNATAQPLDIPHMIEAGGRLVFAWTDAVEERVMSAAIEVE